MEILRSLETYEIPIYVVIGLASLFFLRKLLQAWGEWRSALFGLEQEIAQRRFSSALTVLIVMALLAAAEFVLVTFVSPVYPGLQLLPTPTLVLLPTETPTPPALAQTQPAAQAGGPTPTPSEGCIPGKIEWGYPEAGQEVRGQVELRGTVNLPDLGFYKYEYSTPGTNDWQSIAAGDSVKVDEQIGTWNTGILVPGDYLLRLAVFNSQNQPLPYCIIPIRIVSP